MNAQRALLHSHQQKLEDILHQQTQVQLEMERMRSALQEDPCTAADVLASLPQRTPSDLINMPEPAPIHTDPRSGDPLMLPKPSGQTSANPADKKTGETTAPAATKTNAPATTSTAAPAATQTAQNQQTASATAQQLEQATVLLLTDSPQGLLMGTGFFITPDTILTNRHVVGKGNTRPFVVGKGVGILKGYVVNVSQQAGRDYAVIKVEPQKITPLPLSTGAARTQKVSAWGYPGAITKDDPKFQALLKGQSISAASAPEVVYSEGSVSVVLQRTPPLVVHSAVVSQGNSGGPLVNELGQVVGINTYIKLDDESYRQSSIALATSDIIKYLNELGINTAIVPAQNAGSLPASSTPPSAQAGKGMSKE